MPTARRAQTSGPTIDFVAKGFRFGVGVTRVRSLGSLQEAARRAEDLGFDVVHVPDHLGGPAPFPVMTAIALAAPALRVGTFVVNSAFYRPALLARDVGALHELSEGRFELGLGTGYVKEEFDAAGLRFPSAGERVDHLRDTCEYMAEHLPDVPIMIAGNGDRALRIAASYTAEREQFGRPIGSFQAVQQRMADAFIDTEAIRWTTWHAAWLIAEGRPAARDASIAKFWAAEAGARVVATAQQVHGGMGIDITYPVSRYYLWAKDIELALGTASQQLARLGTAYPEGRR